MKYGMRGFFVGVPAGARRLLARLYARPRWLLALTALLPLLLLSVSNVEVIDDAYITARYSFNLAHGDGLVYNRGERVEGITDLLWALVLAVPARLGLPIDEAAVYLGILAGLLALLGSYRLARLLGASSGAALAAVLFFALNLHYWITVSNGLEGGLFSLLLVLTVESALARRTPLLTGLWAGLLFATRPESALVPLLIGVYVFYEPALFGRNAELRTRALRVVSLLACFGIVCLATELFRWTYYGALLPNSVTAKSVPFRDLSLVFSNIMHGLLYVARFCRHSFTLLLGALLALWLVPSRKVWLLAAVFASELPSVVMNGGDWMGHERLLVVFAPLLASLLALTLDALWSLRKSATSAAVHGLALSRSERLAAPLLLLLLLANADTLVKNVWRAPHAHAGKAGILECYNAIGTRIAPLLDPDDKVATEALGLIGYELPNNYVHDPLGLTDAWVAHHGVYRPRIGRIDYRYTYDKIHPTVVLMHGDDVAEEPFEEAGGSRFAHDYKSYYVDPPAPCKPWDKQRMVMLIRNDHADRLMPALADLNLTPYHARNRQAVADALQH